MTEMPTGFSNAVFESWMHESRAGFIDDLCELVAIPTCSPLENAAHGWLRGRCEALGAHVLEEPRHPALIGHSAANHNSHLKIPAEARSALHVRLPACGAPVRTLFSAHLDVVPTGPNFKDGFLPRLLDGAVVGRGTADTKGNIIMLLAALRFLHENGIARSREVAIDFVNEEEIGGNGALSTLLHGRTAEEVVVLEPTSLEVFHGHRGCLEFTTHVRGRATHMGSVEQGVSAIDGAFAFIKALKELETMLVKEARCDPDFGSWSRALQINIGAIAGGEWHGSVPEDCTVRGAFGFLPSLSVQKVQGLLEDLRRSLLETGAATEISFVYEGIHNEAYRGDLNAPVVNALRQAVRGVGGLRSEPRAWNVSCDARLYHHIGGLPTVVFGAGSLADSHSSHERLRLDEWERGVRALVAFLTNPG